MPEEKKTEALVPQTVKPMMRNATVSSFNPTTFEEAWRWSKAIAGSDLAPKDYRGKPANVLVALQMGAEVGLPPMAALQNIAVINGRPSIWGDAALGIVQASPVYESHEEFTEGDGDNLKAVCIVTRKGNKPHRSEFTVADAKKATLWGKAGTWQTYPKRMLAMRARGFALRDKFADVMRGLILVEEAMDIPPEVPGKTVPLTTALDVDKQLAALTESSEPNRGHGNEGMEIEAKPEEVKTGEVVNPAVRRAIVKIQKFEIKTRKATQAEIDKAKAENRKPIAQEYLLVAAIDKNNETNEFFVWDKPICEAVLEAAEKGYALDVELHKNDKGKEALTAIVERIVEQAKPTETISPPAGELFK